MSHLVIIHTEIRDAAAVTAACHRLKLPEPIFRTVSLFSSDATVLAVQLPGWTYPVVCDTSTGKVRFDNYDGRWGDQKELNRFLQAYGAEKTRIDAHKKGYSVTEQPLSAGYLMVKIHVAGGAA